MHQGIRAGLTGTARLDNSCGIGGTPYKSNLLKTEVKAPWKRPLLMWVIPPKDYRSALAVRGKEDRESGAGVTVTRLRIGFGGERSSGTIFLERLLQGIHYAQQEALPRTTNN